MWQRRLLNPPPLQVSISCNWLSCRFNLVNFPLPSADDDSESENEEQEKANEATTSKRRRHSERPGASASATNSKQERALRRHPLTVNLNIKCKGEIGCSREIGFTFNLSAVFCIVVFRRK